MTRLALVCLSLVCACRKEDGASDSPRSPSPDSPQRVAEDSAVRKVTATTLRPDELAAISERTLVLEDHGAAFTVVSAGKPKTIFSAPYIELAGDGPLTNDRVMVRVRTGRAIGDTTVEAHLLDLDTGSVATFVDAYDWQAQKHGLTYVRIIAEGTETRALLHGRDGRVVPLGAADQAGRSEVHVNPVLGDGWVFAPNPRDPLAASRYAHWADLREPPPVADRELPFPAWRGRDDPWNRRVDDKPMVDVRVPAATDPRGGDPIVVALGDLDEIDGCKRAELRPDGSAPCVDYVQSLADGWRAGVVDGEPVFTNVETGHVQRLASSELCGAFGEGDIPTMRSEHISSVGFSYAPPRMLLDCRDAEFEILWSPEKTVRVPYVGDKRNRRYGWWSRGHELRTFGVTRNEGRAEVLHDHWLDLAGLELVRTPHLANAAGHLGRRTTLVTPAGDLAPLWLLDFDAEVSMRVMDTSCLELAAEQGGDEAWIVVCEGPGRAVRSTEVVRPSTRTRVTLPAATSLWGHRAWVTADGLRAVAIVRRGGVDLVQTWKLP